MTNEGDDVQVEGLHISSSETGNISWYNNTTQPFPRQLMAFEFSATIAKMDKFQDNDFVGLSGGKGSKALRYYLKDGQIGIDEQMITTFKTLTVTDTIRFTVRRIVVDSNTFNLCQIYVNNVQCLSEVVVECIDVYPYISINTRGLELNTAFGIGGSPKNEGMFPHFITE